MEQAVTPNALSTKPRQFIIKGEAKACNRTRANRAQEVKGSPNPQSLHGHAFQSDGFRESKEGKGLAMKARIENGLGAEVGERAQVEKADVKGLGAVALEAFV
ncbi:hypothetical protein RJ641_023275 [Dillenia turbinata]|uniref:Uncharacterized protein n=1 Tax=Dillenia turbinata TaxID=194707 RepID=A0AAN8UIN8_9MAGN